MNVDNFLSEHSENFSEPDIDLTTWNPRYSKGNTRRARMNQESNNTRMGMSATGASARIRARAMVSLLQLPTAGTRRERTGSTQRRPSAVKMLMPRVTQFWVRMYLGRLIFRA